MRTICEEPWRRRMSSSRLREVIAFEGESLVLGCDTRLWKPPTDPAVVTLRTDVAHDRLIALLAVAGRGRVAKATVLQLDAALDDWCRGERAMAAIRLAFVRSPRVRDLDDAHALFLAETALDAGLSPNDLLKELGYAACVPLLKDYRIQPRVPAGCGRTSGQWTCDASGVSFVMDEGPTAIKPIADRDGTLRPTPVFLRPEDGETEDVEDKARRLLDESVQERIREGRPLPKEVPGAFEIAPLPEGVGAEGTDPAAASSGAKPGPAPGRGEAARPTVPQTDAAPSPKLKPAPGGGGSSTDSPSRDDNGPACPKQEDDVGNGPNESGDNEEYRLSWRINPENPTPKYSTWTPTVRSKGYFLPSQTPRGRISFDDCKQSNTPTTLPIPGLRQGDLFEIKAGKWGWELSLPHSAGYKQFKDQVENQNAAVVAEGLGRQIYYCLPNQAVVEKAREIYADLHNGNSHFLVCP